MGYADAIEQQLAVLALFGSPRGVAYFDGIREAILGKYNAAPTSHDHAKSILSEVGQGSPYFVASDIVGLLATAEMSWPTGVRVAAERLPDRSGWVTFERPLPPVVEGTAPIVALSWQVIGIQLLAAAGLPQEDFPALSVTGYIIVDEYWHPVPMIYEVIPFDIQRAIEQPNARLYRFLACLCAFMDQRILAVGRRHITSRSTRKRIERATGHIPEVHVIELRRRDYQQCDESQPRTVEYSCQWLVRGHWHQYHTKEGMQPRWVAPYVKGPGDKPLRVASQTAYAVVR